MYFYLVTIVCTHNRDSAFRFATRIVRTESTILLHSASSLDTSRIDSKSMLATCIQRKTTTYHYVIVLTRRRWFLALCWRWLLLASIFARCRCLGFSSLSLISLSRRHIPTLQTVEQWRLGWVSQTLLSSPPAPSYASIFSLLRSSLSPHFLPPKQHTTTTTTLYNNGKQYLFLFIVVASHLPRLHLQILFSSSINYSLLSRKL